MKFPERVELANLPTPVHRLGSLSDAFGVDVFIKRDDMTGCAESGNKIRKLGFVVADALKKGCDTLVTCGGADSNHARATAIACRRYNLTPVLILRSPKTELVGNLLLDSLVDADIRFFDEDEYYTNLNGIKEKVMDELERNGRKPYWVPTGASMPIGAVGYARCASEIADYQKETGVTFDRIYFATGSGGTAAGLLVGSKAFRLLAELIGVNTGEDTEELRKTTRSVAEECAELLGLSHSFRPEDVKILDGYDAGGYGVVDKNVVKTIKKFAKEEGIILDPVYTAKAAAGLLGELQSGRIKKGEKVLFIHTGGLFAIFTHYRTFGEPQ